MLKRIEQMGTYTQTDRQTDRHTDNLTNKLKWPRGLIQRKFTLFVYKLQNA